jgi:hypothetical protein
MKIEIGSTVAALVQPNIHCLHSHAGIENNTVPDRFQAVL